MSGAWEVALVFAIGMAAFWWGVWVWAVFHMRWLRRRGIEPNKVQVEAREWPAAIALGFTALAAAAWLAS